MGDGSIPSRVLLGSTGFWHISHSLIDDSIWATSRRGVASGGVAWSVVTRRSLAKCPQLKDDSSCIYTCASLRHKILHARAPSEQHITTEHRQVTTIDAAEITTPEHRDTRFTNLHFLSRCAVARTPRLVRGPVPLARPTSRSPPWMMNPAPRLKGRSFLLGTASPLRGIPPPTALLEPACLMRRLLLHELIVAR